MDIVAASTEPAVEDFGAFQTVFRERLQTL